MFALIAVLVTAVVARRSKRQRSRNDFDFGYERDIVDSPWAEYSAVQYRQAKPEKSQRAKAARRELFKIIEKKLKDEIKGRKR